MVWLWLCGWMSASDSLMQTSSTLTLKALKAICLGSSGVRRMHTDYMRHTLALVTSMWLVSVCEELK